MESVSKNSLKTVELVYVAVCSVLIAVCSWISIPSVIPFTLQTFAVFCVLELIGGKPGTLSIIIYILLAAIGVPVLANFSGGPGVLFGLTGGYILGFVIIGLLYWFSEKHFGRRLFVRVISMLLGLFLCYAFGTAWFLFIYSRQTGPVGIGTALAWCVIPFIIPDLLKLGLAVALASRLRKSLFHLDGK